MMKNNNAGQTLIEVVIAVGLVVLVLTTLASGIAIGVKNNRVARDQASAKEYVRQSLEWVRNLRDQEGWESFTAIAKNGTYCLSTLPSSPDAFNGMNPSSCGSNKIKDASGADTVFTREVTFTKAPGNPTPSVTILSEVKWKDGTPDFISKSTLTMYSWK